MATASVIFGGFGAVGRVDLDDVLAYSSIAQVGFVVLPLAVAATVTSPAIRTVGVAAALVYAFNHGLAKGLLFLVSGTIEDALGTTDMAAVSGLAARSPLLAGAFLTGALALVGVPPLSGFFGKFLVFDAAARAYAGGASGAGIAIGVALLGAILTIAYYTRAWNAVFWGDATELVDAVLPTRGPDLGASPAGGAVADGAGRDEAHTGVEGTDDDRDAATASGDAEAEADRTGEAETEADRTGEEERDAAPARDDSSPDDQESAGTTGDEGRVQLPHSGGHPGPASRRVALAGEVTIVVSMAIAVVAFGVGFEPVVAAAQGAAEAALDTGGYVDAVAPAAAEEVSGS
jgi:formate hydrogenlyase subunit 3/multisubunit Na+/H+ antiporter MnhD subunit